MIHHGVFFFASSCHCIGDSRSLRHKTDADMGPLVVLYCLASLLAHAIRCSILVAGIGAPCSREWHLKYPHILILMKYAGGCSHMYRYVWQQVGSAAAGGISAKGGEDAEGQFIDTESFGLVKMTLFLQHEGLIQSCLKADGELIGSSSPGVLDARGGKRWPEETSRGKQSKHGLAGVVFACTNKRKPRMTH